MSVRTLFLAYPRSDLRAHSAFENMFDGCKPFQSNSLVTSQDVMFFDGGTDVNSTWYGEEKHPANGKPDTRRDDAERLAFHTAQQAGAACLGICRGAQILTVLTGGKLIQHVEGHYGEHLIDTSHDGIMFSESSHHQLMYPYGKIGFIPLAWAKDKDAGTVWDDYGKTLVNGRALEVIYLPDTSCLCIQGHPEFTNENSLFRGYCRKLVTQFVFNKGKKTDA